MASPIRMSGLNSGLDTESIVSALVSNYSSKVKKFTKEQTKLGWKQETWKEVNKNVYGFYTTLSSMRYTSAYDLKSSYVSDKTKATVTTAGNAAVGTHSLKIKSLAKSAYISGAEISAGKDGKGKVTADTKLGDLKDLGTITGDEGKIKITFKEEKEGSNGEKELVDGKEKVIELKKDMTVGSFINKIREAGLYANFDSKLQRIYISSDKSGAKNNFKITGEGNGENFLKALGIEEPLTLDEIEKKKNNSTDKVYKGATKVDGQDALITLDGVDYTSESNSISVNGITVNALAETDKEISITTIADTKGLYDKIKDFLGKYNDVINELTSKYNADPAKGMDVLSDDEKKAMGEATAAKYEDKIKDSLLRRDTTLNSIITIMTNSMSRGFTIKGKNYSLSSFGIQTLGILNAAKNEQYAYHINGDKDDEKTETYPDKLMKALTEDPDTVMTFMKKLSEGLYSQLDKKMKSTYLNSAYTIYNDKEMDREYRNYSSLIKTWSDKVDSMEDYYYRKFSRMESSLAKLQGQQESLGGMIS